MAEVLYYLCSWKQTTTSMAAHLFNRYVWLLDQVSRGGKKFEHISNAWEKSPLNDRPGEPLAIRTFHNHIKAIEDMFDIRIRCQRQGGYVYVLEDNESAEISQMQSKLLNQLLVSNIHLEQKHSEYVIMPKMTLHRFVTTIFEAISQSRKIRILWGWSDGESCVEDRWVEVAPYYVKGYNNDFYDETPCWYLFGEGQRGGIQVYALKNIKEVELLDDGFKHPQTPFEEIEQLVFSTPRSQADDDDSLGACIDSRKERGAYKNIFNE